jgi:hypothetical protein
VRSTHPVPVPSPPGAGWINKPSGPRPPVRLIPFPSFLAPPLPRLSPLLSSSSCSARSRPAARAPAVAVKDSPRPEGRVGCTDLGAACPRWWGEAAPASRNVSSRYTRGGAVVVSGFGPVSISLGFGGFAWSVSVCVVTGEWSCGEGRGVPGQIGRSYALIRWIRCCPGQIYGGNLDF